ncbi:VWA domain-containing protein [Cryptosporangium arvum]|uniref:VWA domain-containing protein n=1 Tax=Cryptosporangium arvum TaxID=80871 RepID=UPI0004B50C65|nr:vWA domain-containing protein [Cryptosporangium arvum]
MTTLAPGPRFGRSPRLGGPSRRLWWTLAALLLLLPLLWLLFTNCQRQEDPAPVSGELGGYALEGKRGKECLRLTLMVDSSGSMQDYAGARDAALARLVPWLATNLRDTDQLSVVDFAETATVRLPPTTAKSAGAPAATGVADGGGTLLEPALAQVDAFRRTRCETALLLLSDAQVTDIPTSEPAARALLRKHRISDVKLLVPGQGIEVPDSWLTAFPDAQPRKFDGYDPDATAVAIGRTVAELTGQKLSR